MEPRSDKAVPDAAATDLHDRRRPGRADDVSPHLVGLLRGFVPAANVPADAAFADLPGDDLDAVKGIGLAVAIIFPVWILAALGAFWFFH